MSYPDDPPFTSQTSPAGSIGRHPSRELFPIFVGPSTSTEFNTIRDPLVVIACWRMDDIRFAFNSSLLMPDSADEFTMLSVLMRAHPNAPLSLFGHADPVGDDEYNKRLSGRRATVVYATLLRDTAKWEQIYNNSEDHWGVQAIQVMLDKLGHAPGRTDGTMDQGTRDALNRFQPGATNNASTRQALFAAYMDAICKDINGAAFRLTTADFAAAGADANGKGDYQGCGEFNPVLMFSSTENNAFNAQQDKTARNEENQPNRRVDGFLFRPGTRIDPARWPCPAANDGTSVCRTRFYANAATRRSFQANRRTHAADNDTFACRFFDLVSDRSPCTAGHPVTTMRVIFQLYPGLAGGDGDRGIANVPYHLRIIGESESNGTTGADGGVNVTMPQNGTAVLEIFGTQYVLGRRDTIEALNTMQGVQRRLTMLGFEADAVDGTVDHQTDEAMLRVQADNNRDTDGESNFHLNSGTISANMQTDLRGWVGE